MEYEFSEKVYKKLKRLKRKDYELFSLIKIKLEIFRIDEKRPSLRLHKLSGGMMESWSISINESIRMVFYYRNKRRVVFTNFGKHEEVYKR